MAEPEPIAADVPERPFPDDSLHELLVAEFALRRKEYDVALNKYMTQSTLLRDKSVSSHTVHLSQFMRREDELYEATKLWVELEPDNIEANSIMGNLLVRQGRAVEALPHLTLAARDGKSTNYTVLLNGYQDLSEEQQTALATGINELALEFPDDSKLILTQALIQTEQHKYDEALDKLERLFEIEPRQPQALMLEAKILSYQKAAQPYAHIDRVLAEEPENKLLRLQYARMLTAVDMELARAQFEILSTQSPRDGDLLFSLALINKEMGDYPAASAYLLQIIALQQRIDEANYYLGRIEEDKDQPLEAASYYMQVEDGKQYLAANSRIAQIFFDAGQHDKSNAWFDEQREENPQRREQLYGLQADVLTRSGAPELATSVLNSALNESPRSPVLLYSRAMLAEQQNDLTTMEKDLRRILDDDPDNTTALNALGYTLANRTDRYPEALELVSRALALQPNEPAILDSMGWVLFRSGRHEEAIQYLSRAYAEFPDPEVAAHLGEVLWATGKTEAAKTVWQGASIRDPNHPVLRTTLDRLGVESLRSAAPATPTVQTQP
ncbi:MAG: tetratricopeptide (TPR) repeat protein [Halioglobus sp.]|jgi:tetratricopeptide (TPR) repeat protein